MAAPMIKSLHSIQTQSGMNLDYVVYMPDGLSGELPLVLFLHGAGERGKNIDLVDIHGFTKQAKAGIDLPFILAAPQCPLDRYWSEPELVDGLINIQKSCFIKFNVDTERFYVTGLSMGGYGTYALASKIPHKIAAALPICGAADLKTIHQMKNIFLHVDRGLDKREDHVPPWKPPVKMLAAFLNPFSDLAELILESIELCQGFPGGLHFRRAAS